MTPRQFDASATASGLVKELAPHIKGKVILTTGPSPGSLGDHFLRAIATAEPRLLILSGRTPSKLQQTVDAIHRDSPDVATRLLQLKLDSLQDVRAAAETVMSDEWADVPAIDVLLNNAGIMAAPFSLTVDGFENHFATNHLGHFLFTNMIMPKILASSSPRVVNVSSDGHRLSPIRWADINFNRGDRPHYDPWRAYGQSKTANMLMTLSLAEKLGPTRGLQAYSLHPGVTNTNLGAQIEWGTAFRNLREVEESMGNEEAYVDDFKWKTADQCVATHVYAAFEPSLKEKNGAYLQDARVADPWTDTVKPWATSSIEAERLWKLSEELVGQDFSYKTKQPTTSNP
ncbi:hypothetical protein B0H66DRAFT_383497 [Apodospora peruviana]|uniref:Short-chain dehydrogenase n=1 Tax=Apodospora peruviana TaxID=516989 RepID=A0AAE0HU34_9PEZI|nr:hypothetical protein B0H66DRAFT_383497 [Apodospora peruviana]